MFVCVKYGITNELTKYILVLYIYLFIVSFVLVPRITSSKARHTLRFQDKQSFRTEKHFNALLSNNTCSF